MGSFTFVNALRKCYKTMGPTLNMPFANVNCNGNMTFMLKMSNHNRKWAISYFNQKQSPLSHFRYEMSNCLFEAAYEEILHRCNCTPSFHQTGIREYPWICTGTKLLCMKSILQRIGKYNVVNMIK